MISISKKDPFIILLDLDHTIQGNIQPQLDEYNFISYLNDKTKSKLKQNRDQLKRDFMKGLLRPQFRTFINKMRSRFPNVEFFVYTASDDDWAKYIIKVIEEASTIRFNKRIFSRSDCIFDQKSGHFMKSLNKLKPELFKILKSKYKLSNMDSLKHILLIDNNYVLYDNESKSLIKCPSYTSTIRVDMLRSLPVSFIKNNQELISMYILGYYEKNLHTLYKKVYDKSIHHDILHDNYWIYELKTFKRNYRLTS
uniref:FCP1 homology domain-containing protein n=1 Tax=viral metagenome TaxID=1070528 RepID=A0A6C0CU02_9ZZZZ